MEDKEDTEQLEISVHALAGSATPQTMQVQAFVKKSSITVLIDLGSTHNFVDPAVTRRLHCWTTPNDRLEVMVVKGGKLAFVGNVLI